MSDEAKIESVYMAKRVFRPNEVEVKTGGVMLPLMHEYVPKVETVEVVEEPKYEGPTADDLRREAEDFKIQWEVEKQDMLNKAKAEADEIIKNAENAAFDQVKIQQDKAQVLKADAEKEAADIIQKAKDEAAALMSKAKAEEASLRSASNEEGYATGREDGFKQGQEEVQRLISRLHSMLEGVQNRRQAILDETEQQIVDLVLLMTRKVVKVLSENQKNVVMANVLSALKKVKGRGGVILHVNFADVKLTTEHIKDFIASVESVKGITVAEDSTVDQGGCIVETDFGAIDARISSQLAELEQKILEISPVKNIAKTDSSKSDTKGL